jgi:hypothetical protein
MLDTTVSLVCVAMPLARAYWLPTARLSVVFALCTIFEFASFLLELLQFSDALAVHVSICSHSNSSIAGPKSLNNYNIC